MDYLQKWRRSLVIIWCIFSIFLFAVIVLPLIETEGGSGGQRSFYVRSNEGKRVIIFVHGVLGDSLSTWTNPETKAFWPDLLVKDRTFDHYNIYVYGFASPLAGKSYTIDELADNMRLVLRQAEVLGHSEFIFLSHSMGGLVTMSGTGRTKYRVLDLY